nr:hypothetical protein [Anthocerotibacter panamensis]
MKRYQGPMALKDFLAKGVDLALKNNFHPSSFKAKIEATYTGKE